MSQAENFNPQSESNSSALAGNPQFEIKQPESPAPSPEPPAPPRRRGRRYRLDDAKRREICALISAGAGIPAAARYVGCAASTIHREALRNDDFREQLRRACLAAQLSPLHAMRRAADNHWRAAAWLLERIDPQRFAKQNVKLLKREQLEEFTAQIVEALNGEIKDSESRQRIIRRFDAILLQMDREQEAQSESFQNPRRVPRKAAVPAQSAAWPGAESYSNRATNEQ